MSFGSPQFLYLLAALPALMLFLWWAWLRRAAALRRIGDQSLVERLGLQVGQWIRGFRLALWFVAIALLILSLARPQWGSDIEIVEQSGVQVMVALDISRSMLAQDLKPTRLDRAKLELSDLISRLDGDEVGIVLFSGASFVQFPLTSDYATARTYLNHASPNAITRQGTVIAEAIETAMAGFSTERENQKVIVIMTDGENHEGDPVTAAREAAGQDAVIYTVGFGSAEGGLVPEYDERGDITGYSQNAEGQTVLSRIDEVALQQIAKSGGGRYFRATDGGAIAGLADEIQSFQDESLQSEFNQRRVERFQLFLLAGALCLALAELTTDRLTLPRRTRPGAPGGGCLRCLFAKSWLPLRCSRSA